MENKVLNEYYKDYLKKISKDNIQKYNEKRMKKEEKIAERSVEKENNAFLKELLDSTKKD